ncbi:MAG: helix-turn-helix transcriptional regulator [Chitinophagaceae bacterium]|nr:helix-turn-helix transcriptional regulator [Chitinophagaceae bacterium]
MRKKKPVNRPVAEELSDADIEKILSKIGMLLQAKRKARTTLESFSYEINISRSAMTRYEAGSDMYLSTFLKLLHGLDITLEEFARNIK